MEPSEQSELNEETAFALLANIKHVIPYFPVDMESMAFLAAWLVDHCKGTAKVTPWEHASRLVARAGRQISRWDGLPGLEAINQSLVDDMRGPWRPSWEQDGYGSEPVCETCQGKGYYQPAEREPWVLCSCGSCPESAEACVRFQNQSPAVKTGKKPLRKITAEDLRCTERKPPVAELEAKLRRV